MSDHIEVSATSSHVHSNARGVTSSAELRAMWSVVLAKCEESHLNRVLLEVGSQSSFSTSELFWLGEHLSTLHWPQGAKIAVVCDPQDHAQVIFTENVLLNRCAIHSRVFNAMAEAERWLKSNTNDA